MADREILIRISFGDLQTLWQAIAEPLKMRRPREIGPSVKTWLWLRREHRRRGIWQPWTVGNHHLQLLQKEAHLRHFPRRTPWPAPWRHGRLSGRPL